jgi:hypothetical protein
MPIVETWKVPVVISKIIKPEVKYQSIITQIRPTLASYPKIAQNVLLFNLLSVRRTNESSGQ